MEVDQSSNGIPGSPITFSAFGDGAAPVIRQLIIRGDYIVFENLVIDQNKGTERAVSLRNAKNCTLRNLVIRNGTNNGIDLAGADGLLIDSCLVHHFLAGSFVNPIDAHGIVAERTQGLSIRNTEVHHVSGDSFQADPNRSRKTNDILIENCHFWTGPLKEDFSEFWLADQIPGENAIDTKVTKGNLGDTKRMRMTLRNIYAHGWVANQVTSNRAAFNMKEKIEAIFDSVMVHNCEIAFRLRGTRGNAKVTILNTVVSDCRLAIRAEDNLADLKLYNNTFGYGIDQHILLVPKRAKAAVSSWDIRNCAFVNKKPSQAKKTSNKVAGEDDFIDFSLRDYRLKEGSRLIDIGDNSLLDLVKTDQESVRRYLGDGYDVGAFESDGALPIIANFTAELTQENHAPLLVQFKDLSAEGSHPIVQWDWDFGDGNVSKKQNPEHLFARSGSYQVKLTVCNGVKANTRIKKDFVLVGPFRVGDLNGDGAISSFDADLILQYTKGALSQFPIETIPEKTPIKPMPRPCETSVR